MEYEGSLAIDQDLMEMVGLYPGEKILVGNFSTGDRFETYAIVAERGSRTFSVNGAAGRKAMVGDLVVIMSFGLLDENEVASWKPKTITLANHNQDFLKTV